MGNLILENENKVELYNSLGAPKITCEEYNLFVASVGEDGWYSPLLLMSIPMGLTYWKFDILNLEQTEFQDSTWTLKVARLTILGDENGVAIADCDFLESQPDGVPTTTQILTRLPKDRTWD